MKFIFCNISYQVVKILNATDEHVMALGANFSLQADSHLVCIQNEQGYKTQAINIQNQARKGNDARVHYDYCADPENIHTPPTEIQV